MKRMPVLFAASILLVGGDPSPPLSIDALSADPARLHALRAQCREGARGGTFCAQVARADLQRFLSGRTGPDEYQSLADLPPIPATFDDPAAVQEQEP